MIAGALLRDHGKEDSSECQSVTLDGGVPRGGQTYGGPASAANFGAKNRI